MWLALWKPFTYTHPIFPLQRCVTLIFIVLKLWVTKVGKSDLCKWGVLQSQSHLMMSLLSSVYGHYFSKYPPPQLKDSWATPVSHATPQSRKFTWLWECRNKNIVMVTNTHAKPSQRGGCTGHILSTGKNNFSKPFFPGHYEHYYSQK